MGNGAGGFSAATNFASGTNSNSVAGADFNGDGKVDLAVTNFTINKVSILLGNGTGGFGVATTHATGTYPFCIVNADFNSDGFQDIATGNFNSNNVSVLLGSGTGSFATAANFPEGISVNSMIAVDLNLDGKPDIATTVYGYCETLLNCSVSGITNFSDEKNISIYPNPSQNNFTIETTSNEKLIIQIVDVNGKQVLSQTINGTTTLDGSNLSQGVYNINVKGNLSTINKKLIILK